MGQDSSVGIATSYELDGLGIESRWGRDIPHPSRTGLLAHPASCTMGTGSFPGVKRPGHGVNHPPLSSPEVKERVELYVYSLSVPSWQVIWWNLLSVCVYYMLTANLKDGNKDISHAPPPHPQFFKSEGQYYWNLIGRHTRSSNQVSFVPPTSILLVYFQRWFPFIIRSL